MSYCSSIMFAGFKWIDKLVALFFISAFFVLVSQASADEEAEASLSATPEVINSYNLFWPLVAGKTEADSLYSLKILKEMVLRWLIFDDTKKADYAVLLGTKRVLEAEKLLEGGKVDLARTALKKAEVSYGEAYDHMTRAHEKSKFSPEKVRRDRLVNAKSLIDYLKTVAPQEVQAELDSVKDKANILLRDYLVKGKDREFNT